MSLAFQGCPRAVSNVAQPFRAARRYTSCIHTDYRDLGTPGVDASKTVTLDIDGVSVTVPEGTSIMRAAATVGRQVPKLCATDTLKAFGSCRLCLVEIEGRKGYPASCTTLVADGIKVRTEIAQAHATPSRCDGALYLRPPARLRNVPCQWPLRASGHGRRPRHHRVSVRPERQEPSAAAGRTRAIPISPSTPRCASSVRDACGRATRSRERLR